MSNDLFTLTDCICPKCKTLLYQYNSLQQCDACGYYQVITTEGKIREYAGAAMSIELKTNNQ
jgi:uncharacterized Zn finger protein (UPF0148 family)